MYKWPQGRVIRMICLLAVVCIALDLGFHGYNHLITYFAPEGDLQADYHTLVIGIIEATLSAGVFFAGLISVGFHHKAVDFLIEVEQEMVRVTWPTSRMLVQSTIWIAVMVGILTTLVFAWDYIALFYVINPLIGTGK